MLHKFAIINVYKILNYHNSNEQIDFLEKVRQRNTAIIISVTVQITTFKSNYRLADMQLANINSD